MEFEEKFKKAVDSSFAVATSSGTAALHLAVTALGVKPGQTVLVPSLTFAATANAVLYAGGKIEFIDIMPDTFTMDIESVRQKILSDSHKYAGVIGVDFAGLSLNMKQLATICREYGIWLVEDAAHALGAVDNFGDRAAKFAV
jgi:dTDP-4-amino-4,6-dideoxygalactose transaminase